MDDDAKTPDSGFGIGSFLSFYARFTYAFLLRSTSTVPPTQAAASRSQIRALELPVSGVSLLSVPLEATDEASSDEASSDGVSEDTSDEVSSDEVSGT